MKKFTKNIVAAILSGTMIMGMSATAFAATTQQGTGVSGYTGAGEQITKTWSVSEDGLLNDTESFTFTLKYKDATAIGTNATSTPIYNGSAMAQGNDSKSVNLTDKWKTNANGVSSVSKMSYDSLFSGIRFTAPGEYHFDLTEEEGSNPNIAYSEESYRLNVQVVWETDENGTQTGNLKVAGITTTDLQGEEKVPDGAGFANTPAAATTLKVSKEVSGNAASKSDVFSFSITVRGISGVYSTNKAGVTVENGKATTFTLKHGETFVINNLPAGATYVVNETDAKGYDTTKVSVNGENAVTGKSAEGTVAIEAPNTVAYTNIETVSPPTGIVLHFAPILVAFAALFGGCLVFFRRKRL